MTMTTTVNSPVKLIECPRDAMQGLTPIIPTEVKVRYIQQLLSVGFDTLDFGSFVSPKAIPQMADTAHVLESLDLSSTHTKLLAIIANSRGAADAAAYSQISYLGYPFSVSETFQIRNTNATIQESLGRVSDILEIADTGRKEVVIYISMGFGNPYGDPWNVDIVLQWVHQLREMGVRIFSLSDTIGVSSPDNISYLFESLIPALPDIEFGAHLHTTPASWKEKVHAAYESGCRRFDGALKGYGGCPMAREELTGNMPTEKMIGYFEPLGCLPDIRLDQLEESLTIIPSVFPHG